MAVIRPVVLATAFLAWTLPLTAQCTPQWLAGIGAPGVDGAVVGTAMWDRDGAGPLPPLLVVGGSFATAGNVVANGIATFDPASGVWAALGSGANGSVQAVAALPNGDLVAAGSFTSAGLIAANRVARWDGAIWSVLGTGCGNTVNALLTLPSGDLVAGGSFTTAGGVAANRIARWDGFTWSALGAGMSSTVTALATLANGNLVAGGWFTAASGIPVNRVARWNGATWSALAAGTNAPVAALAGLPNGDLVAGGDFTAIGGVAANYVGRWNGTVWSPRGTGLPTLAFVARVTGLGTTSLLLGSVLPPSPVGCSLLVTPDLVDAVLTTTGTVDAQLALPNAASLAGLVLHQQFVALQVDALGNLVQNTSTNRLTATVGTF